MMKSKDERKTGEQMKLKCNKCGDVIETSVPIEYHVCGGLMQSEITFDKLFKDIMGGTNDTGINNNTQSDSSL